MGLPPSLVGAFHFTCISWRVTPSIARSTGSLGAVVGRGTGRSGVVIDAATQGEPPIAFIVRTCIVYFLAGSASVRHWTLESVPAYSSDRAFPSTVHFRTAS